MLVGEPVEVADLLEAARAEGWAESRLHVAIAERVGQRLYALKAQLEGVAVEAVAPGGAAAARTFTDDALLPLIGARGRGLEARTSGASHCSDEELQ